MTALFPTAYFGSIAYFRELLRFPSAEIEVWDTFPKQTFRNRCTILGPQGEHRLTVPIEKPGGSKTLTKDIRVSDVQDWRTNHWRAIRSNYASAPYFEHYASDIEALLFTKEPDLAVYNSLITVKLAALFGFEIVLKLTSDFRPTEQLSEDHRAIVFDNLHPAETEMRPYMQVLFGSQQFYANPSILDLLFCEGPLGRKKLIFEKKA